MRTLLTYFPRVVDFWNDDRDPSDFRPFSEEIVSFKCKNGHEWKEKIRTMSKRQNCSYCSGRKVCKDNCLATTHAELVKEWNDKTSPFTVHANSRKQVIWKCKNNHIWKTSIRNRAIQGKGCSKCKRLIASSEYNFEIVYPEIAKDWGNNKKLPNQYTPKSGQKVHWICKNNHQEYKSIKQRVETGCTKCNKTKISKNYNLETICPHIKEIFDYEKNNITPDALMPGSNRKIWLKCENGHSFRRKVNKINEKTTCLKCSGAIPTKTNNLYVNFPDLMKEWDYKKNKIDPRTCSNGKKLKVWWKCKNGHSWKTSIYKRTYGSGCPACVKNRTFSKKGNLWLDENSIKIREKQINTYKVDGFKDNIVYEYLGNYWHGNPKYHNPKDKHPSIKCNFGLILIQTIQRLNQISQYFPIIYRWEDENTDKTYKIIKKSKKEILELAIYIYKSKLDIDILEEL